MSPERSREGLQRSTSYGMKIACLGLSANPPHMGHVVGARIVLGSGYVDEVWLIPAFKHPFSKPDMASWHHRLAMTRLLEEPGIVVSDAEYERGGTSYTIDTLRYLQEKYPEHEFYWAVGSDIVTSGTYVKWRSWEELRKNFKFIVFERPGYPITQTEVPDNFLVIDPANKAISSTDVRRMVHSGDDIAPHVGEEMADYIKKHKLYRG